VVAQEYMAGKRTLNVSGSVKAVAFSRFGDDDRIGGVGR